MDSADMAGQEVVLNVDQLVHAWQGRLTGGFSPSSLMLASLDWAVHLADSPGKQLELIGKAARKAGRLGVYASQQAPGAATPPCIEPLPQDQRFEDPAWRQWPFAPNYQAFLLIQQWWHNATTGVEGVSQHHEDVVTFAARQILDIFARTRLLRS
jgi:poly[(R)-3-hydroxyalkanoate] polymerase subunit PhaC